MQIAPDALDLLEHLNARTPLSADAMDSFLHLPNLVFHEAGHLLFAMFGQFMSVLGGSLTQVLIPVIAMIAFIRQEQPFGAAVCGWWAGQNLVDLAPYIADARALQLVLLGGRTGAEVEGHDWEYLLTTIGVVHRDQAPEPHCQVLHGQQGRGAARNAQRRIDVDARCQGLAPAVARCRSIVGSR